MAYQSRRSRGERPSSSRSESSSRARVSKRKAERTSRRSVKGSAAAAAAVAVETEVADAAQEETPSRFSSNPYSRGNVSAEYKRVRKGRGRRKILTGFLVALLVCILAGGGVAFAYVMKLQSNMHQGLDEDVMSVLDPTYGGDPFYMLLMGVDGSYERGANEMNDNENTRSDSMILARIDPDKKQVTMISLHRDILLDMGRYGQQKLNAAHSLGGTAYAIQTVEELAGVDISHYAEINFDAFKAMVDALGGVTVNVPMEIDDWRAGGYVPAGEQTLTGEQALILCRARHAYDAYGDGDTYRAANQRMVLGAIMEKVLSSDPVTMANTIEALSQYVVTDLGITDIVAMATQMVGIDMDTGFYTAMTPTTSMQISGGWYEKLNKKQWNAMMERVEQGLPPTEEDVIDETGTVLATSGSGTSMEDLVSKGQRSGTVSVKNGAAIDGACEKAESLISPLGYTVKTGDAKTSDYKETVIVYEKDSQRQYAEEIAEALGCGRVLQNEDEYIYSADFLVVVGADWDVQ